MKLQSVVAGTVDFVALVDGHFVQVADCPHFLDLNHMRMSNLLYVAKNDLHIPLHLDGVIGYFPFH
jgi:hypothetical protein